MIARFVKAILAERHSAYMENGDVIIVVHVKSICRRIRQQKDKRNDFVVGFFS